MKKFLSILLVLAMVFVLSCSVFATETVTSEENVDTASQVEEISNVEEEHNHEGEEATTQTTGVDETTDITATPSEEAVEEENKEDMFLTAKVIEAGEITEEQTTNQYGAAITASVQKIKVKVLNGTTHKNQEVEITHQLTKNDQTGEVTGNLKVGQKVFVQVYDTQDENGQPTTMGQVVLARKDNAILIVAIIIIVALLVLSVLNGLKTVGVMLLNTIVTVAGFLILYFLKIPAIVTLAILAVVIIVTNMLILQKPSKETWVTILAIVLATVVTFGVLTLVVSAIGLRDSSTFDLSITQEEIDSMKMYYGIELKPLQVEYIDVLSAIMIIISLGVTMDIAITSCKKAQLGKSFMETLKEISTKLPKRLNTVYLIVLAVFLMQFIQAGIYRYPLMLIFNDDQVFIEAIKMIVVLINPIIVIPITVLLTKELLGDKRAIEEPKKD